MSGFFSQLLERPPQPSNRLSRFTERCGYVYILIGLVFLFAPTTLGILGLIPPFQGQEEALVRVIGFTLSIIGYFYIFGGRTQHNAFGLSTVLDRLLVPCVLLFIYQASEVELMLILPLGILDPILGLVAYALWRKDQAEL